MRELSWSNWHRDCDNPGSRLSRRLRLVQQQIQHALDRCPPGDIRAISMCAGQGNDLLGVLQSHPRRADVEARLVELDERNVEVARGAAQAVGLPRVEVVAGDASLTDSYAGMAPADLVLVCGVFGNISDADIWRTIRHLPTLCSPDATVIWTRHTAQPDLTPTIRRWFVESAFVELGFDAGVNLFGVGAARFAGTPAEFQPGVRLFNFVGYYGLHPRPR